MSTQSRRGRTVIELGETYYLAGREVQAVPERWADGRLRVTLIDVDTGERFIPIRGSLWRRESRDLVPTDLSLYDVEAL